MIEALYTEATVVQGGEIEQIRSTETGIPLWSPGAAEATRKPIPATSDSKE
jgi:hypothetical protein